MSDLTVKQVRDKLDTIIKAARETKKYNTWNVEFRLLDLGSYVVVDNDGVEMFSGQYVEFLEDADYFIGQCARQVAN